MLHPDYSSSSDDDDVVERCDEEDSSNSSEEDEDDEMLPFDRVLGMLWERLCALTREAISTELMRVRVEELVRESDLPRHVTKLRYALLCDDDATSCIGRCIYKAPPEEREAIQAETGASARDALIRATYGKE